MTKELIDNYCKAVRAVYKDDPSKEQAGIDAARSALENEIEALQARVGRFGQDSRGAECGGSEMTTIARYKFGYSSDEWGMNRSLGLIADAGGDVCRFSDVKALQARVAELERQNKDLDRSETQLIQERDEREEVINALCDTVLGTDRYEWSSMYSFDDAVEEVAVKTAVLDKEVSELYALRKENAKLAAELTAIKNQEPVEIDWPDYHHEAMGCGLEDRNIHDRYEAMQYGWDQAIERVAERLPEEIFAAPIPPVLVPLSDRDILRIYNEVGPEDGAPYRFAGAIEKEIRG